MNKARRECPDNKAPLDLVDAKLTAAENGLETSTFTVCARIRPKLKQDEGDEDFVCVVPGEHGRRHASRRRTNMTPVELDGVAG